MDCGSEIDTVLPLGTRNFMSPIARMISGNLLYENIISLRLSRGANDGLGELILGVIVDGTFYTVTSSGLHIDARAKHARPRGK